MSSNLVQVYTIYINAPAAKVWDAITTPEGTNRWGYGGDVVAELRPGGRLPQPHDAPDARHGHG